MYSIDLPALLQFLQKSRHNGRVYAQVPYGFAGLSGGYAFVDIAQGRTVACYLLNAQKQLILSGNEAMNVISSMGILQWTMGQEYQQANTNLPAVRPSYTTGSQYTNPAMPSIRPYSPNTLYTNSQTPAIRQYPSDTQYTNPRLPMPRLSSTDNTYTTSRTNNTSEQPDYQFSSFVPERIVHIDTNLLDSIARRLRRVLVLVDGQRSIMKIALILYSNHDGQRETFSILKQLEEMSIILIKRP